MGLFSRPSREERFWKWFQAHEGRLFDFEGDRELLEDLSRALSRVEEGLCFEFGSVQNGQRQFAVSADGLPALFDAVRRLVAAAPSMKRWTIVPFRPPGNMDVVLEYAGHQLGPDDLWFTAAAADHGRVRLCLFIRGLTEENNAVLRNASYILLDNALGEFAAVTQLSSVECLPLPEDPVAAGLSRFPEIRTTVDRVHH